MRIIFAGLSNKLGPDLRRIHDYCRTWKTYPFPVLVLLDLKLPDGSGFDALRWLRQHPELAPPATVVLTGSDVHAIRRAYAEGANPFW